MPEARSAPRVRLRDATPADVDRLDELLRRERTDGGFNDFGLGFAGVDRAALARGPLRDPDHGTLLVERLADAAVIGTVGWIAVQHGPNAASRSWMIGIDLAPEARGLGLGAEAQRLVAEYLFATTGANRVEASTDVENVAEQRSLERAGFRREGVHRGAQFRAGTYHDLVVYARLRSDPA